VEAGALTIWSPQIFETSAFEVISRGDVAGRAQVLVRRERKLQAISLLEDVLDTSSATFLVRSIFHSLVRYDLGLLVRAAAAGSKRPNV
jgi:hypothetical protein